jgi:hypothetical protein
MPFMVSLVADRLGLSGLPVFGQQHCRKLAAAMRHRMTALFRAKHAKSR